MITACADFIHCPQRHNCKRPVVRTDPENYANFFSQAIKNNGICDMFISKKTDRRLEVNVEKRKNKR